MKKSIFLPNVEFNFVKIPFYEVDKMRFKIGVKCTNVLDYSKNMLHVVTKCFIFAFCHCGLCKFLESKWTRWCRTQDMWNVHTLVQAKVEERIQYFTSISAEYNMSHLTRQMQGRPHTWAAQSSGTGGYLAYMYIHTSQNN